MTGINIEEIRLLGGRVRLYQPKQGFKSSMDTVMLAAACRRDEGSVPTMEQVHSQKAPTQESWDATFYVTEAQRATGDTRRRLAIEAGYLARYELGDSTYTVMQGSEQGGGTRLKAYLFDAAGDTTATVTADRMVYYNEDRRFEARGDVVVVTDEGRRLESELLNWYEAEREVRTPGFATITTATEQIRGYELVADEDLESFSLARVTGQVLVEEDDDT